MEENRLNILNDSTKTISKLQLLAVFFEDETIYKIFLRSQVIHQLFENNKELDINKLSLFHLQFTASTVELLRKIKKANEQQIELLQDEMQLNKELMEKLENSVYTAKTFLADQQRQAAKINTSLRRLYQVLSEDSNEYPLSRNIGAFSTNYARDFFHEVPRELLEEMIVYNPAEVYRNSDAVIHRKLMGLLCKYEFRSSFFAGIKASELAVELYTLPTQNELRYFLFLPARNTFLFCDISRITNVDWNAQVSPKDKLVQELQDKNTRLQGMVNVKKTYIPKEIKDLLLQNYEKIADVNFLENISNFDVQANILKTMLNTDFM